MHIYDITKFSMLDYPDKLSAILWFPDCNLRCQYCYNSDIIYSKGTISENETLSFLEKRKKQLDAVVLSGGEPTLYNNLIPLCKKIKDLGYLIKLDTNATDINIIKQLIDENLIDSIAVDYKAPSYKFQEITQKNYWSQFSKTLDFLIKYCNSFLEIRTTIHSDILNEKDIKAIINDLNTRKYKGDYYLQNFFKDSKTLNNLKNQTHELNYLEIKEYINNNKISLHTRNFKSHL